MSQKRSLNSFKWLNKTSSCTEDFIKNYNENSYLVHFLEAVSKRIAWTSWLSSIFTRENKNWICYSHKKFKVSIRITELHRLITFNQKAINNN